METLYHNSKLTLKCFEKTAGYPLDISKIIFTMAMSKSGTSATSKADCSRDIIYCKINI